MTDKKPSTKIIHFRVTEQEYQDIKRRAEEEKRTISNYIKSKLIK